MTPDDLIPILSSQSDIITRMDETNILLQHLCSFEMFIIGTGGALLVLFLLYKFIRLFY